MSVISIKNFTKKFGNRTIFENFNLEVEKGGMVAIVGESGSGKTTLLNIIGLIDNIDIGEYTLLSKKSPKANTKKASEIIRYNISYLFQKFALVDNLTVKENLLMALKYKKISNQEKYQLIFNALEQVNLKGFEKAKVFELSGGEQQRVAIDRAFLKPSEIVLADEPTGSLDEKNIKETLKLIKTLNDEGKTIVLVTHDNNVKEFCDRVIQI